MSEGGGCVLRRVGVLWYGHRCLFGIAAPDRVVLVIHIRRFLVADESIPGREEADR